MSNESKGPLILHIPMVSELHLEKDVRTELDAAARRSGTDNRSPYGLYAAPTMHGYFIACGDPSIGDEDLPGSLEAILTWGRQSGYEWVRIDIDGPCVPGLPTYP